MLRIICEIKPRWVLAENVPGLLSINDGWVFGEILRNLSEIGYGFQWNCLPSRILGAPQRRWRLWIVAYAESPGLQRYILDWRSIRIKHRAARTKFGYRELSCGIQTRELSEYLRMGYGRTATVDGLRILGNGQDPRMTEWIGRRIMEFDTPPNPRKARK